MMPLPAAYVSMISISAAQLAIGDHLSGPAIIAEAETSTLIPSGFTMEIDQGGALVLTRNQGRPLEWARIISLKFIIRLPGHLISVVEEQAQTLLRTAFGSVVREAGDLSAGVYDTAGRMLAQAVTGTPGHVNTMAMAVAHFLERFPPEDMRPGDVFVSNDPWMGTGHLFDFVVVTPAFLEIGRSRSLPLPAM